MLVASSAVFHWGIYKGVSRAPSQDKTLNCGFHPVLCVWLLRTIRLFHGALQAEEYSLHLFHFSTFKNNYANLVTFTFMLVKLLQGMDKNDANTHGMKAFPPASATFLSNFANEKPSGL